jgi:hypothetical protein
MKFRGEREKDLIATIMIESDTFISLRLRSRRSRSRKHNPIIVARLQ